MAYPPFYFSPQDLLNSAWLRFALVFVIFYAILFFALNRVFRDSNKAVTITISAAISLLVSLSFYQYGYLDSYVGYDMAGLLILFGFLLIFGFIFRLLYMKISKVGAFFLLFCFWLLLFFSDAENFLPYSLLSDPVVYLYDLLGGFVGLGLLVIAALVAIMRKKKNMIHLQHHH